MNQCKHGVVLYGFCKHCVDDISDKAVIDQERGKRIAIDSIKQQPFYDLQQYKTTWGMSASEVSKHWGKELVRFNKPVFFWNGPKQRIRRQPFFGVDSSLPTTIKFRRPGPVYVGMDMGESPSKAVIDDVIQDSIVYGMGMMRLDPCSVWKINKDDVDFWWGNGKAWPTEKEWGERNIKGATQ